LVPMTDDNGDLRPASPQHLSLDAYAEIDDSGARVGDGGDPRTGSLLRGSHPPTKHMFSFLPPATGSFLDRDF